MSDGVTAWIDANVYVLWAVGATIVYALLMLVARWIYIARPLKGLTEAQIKSVRSRLQLEQSRPETETAREKAVIDQAEGLLDTAERTLRGEGKFRHMVWSGGNEIAAWWLIHDAERQIPMLMTRPAVDARIRRATGEVEELSNSKRKLWKDTLQMALEGRSDDDAKANLSEFLAELYDARDSQFAGLASLQNKVTWVVWVGVLLVAIVTGLGLGWIVFAGAVGGLLSRLQRFLATRGTATDYGLSWALITLSPVAGALSAIVGVVILGLLDVEVLDGIVKSSLTEFRSPSVQLLGLASLLGVSERFLDRIVKEAEVKILPEGEDAEGGDGKGNA